MKAMCPYNFVIPGFKHGNERDRSGGIQCTCLFEKSSTKKNKWSHSETSEEEFEQMSFEQIWIETLGKRSGKSRKSRNFAIHSHRLVTSVVCP